MRVFSSVRIIFIVATICADSLGIPDPSTLPAPPSVAVNPRPLASDGKVVVLVNVIPATAKYVVYAQMKMGPVELDSSRVAEVSDSLSAGIDNLLSLARDKGANLIVLFTNAHGVPVPIRQSKQSLILANHGAVITAVLFNWSSSTDISDEEKRIHFVVDAASPEGAQINYGIELKVNTAEVTKSYWAYSNISRFVHDAASHNLDTISLHSTPDPSFEEVWLPACDTPLHVSLVAPKLDVTVFKRKEPKQPPDPTPPSDTPSVGQAASHP